MTNAELLALLREARESGVLKKVADIATFRRSDEDLRVLDLLKRIDAALAEAEKPVEWEVSWWETGRSSREAQIGKVRLSVGPTVTSTYWWTVSPDSFSYPTIRGGASTLDEAKSAAIRAARGMP